MTYQPTTTPFAADNTQGYDADDLAELNRRWVAMGGPEITEATEAKHRQECLLADYDNPASTYRVEQAIDNSVPTEWRTLGRGLTSAAAIQRATAGHDAGSCGRAHRIIRESDGMEMAIEPAWHPSEPSTLVPR